MMTDEPELYIPRPGGVAWRLLGHLIKNPGAEFTRAEIAEKFKCALTGVDATLQLPTARECLVKGRNRMNQLVWKLGFVKRFRLDPLPTEQYIPGEQPDAVERKPDGVAKWTATGAAPAPAAPRGAPAIKTLAPQSLTRAPAIVVAPAPAPSTPAVQRDPGPALVHVIGRVVGICECRGTVFVATENSVFRYNEKTGDLMHIPFAAQ